MSSSDSIDALDKKRITIKDIARACGVSHATVSRAMRHPELLNETTAKRILAMATELGYDASTNQGARRMVLSRYGQSVLNHLIGLFIPPFFYRITFFTAIFEGIWDVLTPKGFGMLTVKTNPESFTVLPPSFSRGDVDCAILIGSRTMQDVLAQLRAQASFGNRPVVTLMTRVPGCSSVQVDALSGAYALTSHLLDLGHRDLLYLTPSGSRPSQNHQDHIVIGARQALQDHGGDPLNQLHIIQMDEMLELCACNPEHFLDQDIMDRLLPSLRERVVGMLQAYPEITAIMAPNDAVAFLVIESLAQSGIRVPSDISVTGFDDALAESAKEWREFITTVKVPLEDVGREAAKLAVGLLAGKHTKPVHRILHTSLVVRSSTAKAPERISSKL